MIIVAENINVGIYRSLGDRVKHEYFYNTTILLLNIVFDLVIKLLLSVNLCVKANMIATCTV